jgi:tetratricopeptide (TPR) repeat protein
MKTTTISLSLVFAAGFFLSEAAGQDSTTKKKTTPQTKSAGASKVRSRRAVAPASTTQAGDVTPPGVVKPADVKADQGGAASPSKPTAQATKSATVPGSANEVKSDDNPGDALSERRAAPATSAADTTIARPSDPVLTLRNQIDGAENVQERIRLQLKLVDQLVAADKRTDAIVALRQIVNSDDFDPQGFYNTGNSFARLGDTDGAISAYRKAIEQRKGQYSRAFNNLGVVMLRAGRWDEAYDAFLSALKLESFRYAEASYNLGRLYAARGESDLAMREWRRALAADPKHTAAAQALSHIGNEERIVVEQPIAKAPRPSGPQTGTSTKPAPNAMANAKPANLRTSPATRPTKTVAIDQVSYDYLQRARISSEHGNMADAIDNYRRLITRQRGYFPPANLEISYALLSLKRYDEALTNLLEVANRDGARFPISYYHLARVYELKGELKLAENAFSQAAATYGPKNAQFLLDLSRVREMQGDFAGALEAMERYVSITQQQGQSVPWGDERLTSLRQKSATTPK